MPHKSDSTEPRRLSVFWWTLINVLAILFAILSWTGCYFLFNFPERPLNYSLLRKLDRLPETSFFKSEALPKASTLGARQLYGLIYARKSVKNTAQLPNLMDAETLATLNVQLKRNYITHFSDPKNLNYVRGTWRILSVRKLTEEDFISTGFAVLAQALVIPQEQENSTRPQLLPFPVELEIILPTNSKTVIPEGAEVIATNSFELSKANHALAILHLSRSGTSDEPITRITAIPLLGNPFSIDRDTKLPLENSRFVNPEGRFPLMKIAE